MKANWKEFYNAVFCMEMLSLFGERYEKMNNIYVTKAKESIKFRFKIMFNHWLKLLNADCVDVSDESIDDEFVKLFKHYFPFVEINT